MLLVLFLKSFYFLTWLTKNENTILILIRSFLTKLFFSINFMPTLTFFLIWPLVLNLAIILLLFKLICQNMCSIKIQIEQYKHMLNGKDLGLIIIMYLFKNTQHFIPLISYFRKTEKLAIKINYVYMCVNFNVSINITMVMHAHQRCWILFFSIPCYMNKRKSTNSADATIAYIHRVVIFSSNILKFLWKKVFFTKKL